MRNKKNSLVLLIILSIFGSLSFSMAHPVTPMFINVLNLPTFMFGLFFAVMSVGNFIGSPLFGSLSDKKGRIPFLILGVIGYGVSQLGFGFNTNPLIILLFRFTGGFFVVSYLTVSMAYITDLTTKENRIKYLTYYAAANTLGSSAGSLLGGAIGNVNFKNTFFVQFILCMILGLLIFLLLAETHTVSNDPSTAKIHTKINYRDILRGDLLIILLAIGAFYFATTSYNSSINYFIEDVLNLPPSFIGGFLAVTGILGFSVNIIFTPLLAKKFKEINIFRFITFMLSLSLLLMVFLNKVVFFLGMALVFTSFATIHIPLQQSIITKLSKGNYGTIMGILNSFKASGQILGSLSAGFIFDIGNKLPFLLSSAVILISFFSLIPLKPHHNIKGEA